MTEDGSHSLLNSQYNQHYHSVSGALKESRHIYMNLGLIPLLEVTEAPIRVFEMGFGTGLNAFLTWQAADFYRKSILYTGVEAFPVSMDEASQLNYDIVTSFTGLMKLHQAAWFENHQLSENFTFRKEQLTLQEFSTDELFDVIFYDAFDPKAQPELWTEEILSKIAAQLRTGGVLVTYSSKGIVKRALAAAGFSVQKHKGPGKKWHVLKAIKI
ncbi:tRNA (5-methylaminomethyl-2-thiouridine)(34)-methyltransferase MnmD [Dyadobacter sp. CY345]|uniref:tRNA (5-methylaminomethyl-2-thiouridine)(34)-methyltransferase MnmD n=1 Tax=Dyadobacter sp. CY345 TaxID=2909335 RepID=UPI001F463199|nr:tRNA (5-methylaminomethyl-2-thiouridine)(34)-methyltransferase MnmD [Dyadobacter sp. CY345]MCF2445786.1 tRNA (5-methylaminomethyl-2-thiouridine)(34)-methyltransferase MnmD [Dyadobacter sp. CY345]